MHQRMATYLFWVYGLICTALEKALQRRSQGEMNCGLTQVNLSFPKAKLGHRWVIWGWLLNRYSLMTHHGSTFSKLLTHFAAPVPQEVGRQKGPVAVRSCETCPQRFKIRRLLR